MGGASRENCGRGGAPFNFPSLYSSDEDGFLQDQDAVHRKSKVSDIHDVPDLPPPARKQQKKKKKAASDLIGKCRHATEGSAGK